ncbi:MAG: ABC transporter ATP-binding protein [Candidatus Omnitrophota bacterium]|nr:ABC transporter ATP-binding protein [Candidatus Omnitrophota bacterium]
MKVIIEDVSKKFFRKGKEPTEVLSRVNLKIEEGELVSILGPSGCGKSTLLNIVAGLIKPDSGRILVNGRLVAGPASDRVVVFQEAALFPWLSVLENVEFGLRLSRYSIKERRETALKFIKMVHLSKFVRAYPYELSGGMKQRVAIARALAMDPEILLMDEPFGALDAQTRRIMEMELQEIWQETHKTILFVTHNLREAVSLSDRIYLMTARPGTVKGNYTVVISRPRKETDIDLFFVENQIHASLEEEVEKVVKEEMGIDYAVTKDGFLLPADRNLGSDI